MQTGFGRIEGLLIYLIFSALFAVGFYSALFISWPVAVISIVLVVYLWYYLHRIRICNFCDQRCPYRPKSRDTRFNQVGFTKFEGLIFYPSFLLILAFYIYAILQLSQTVGLIMVILVAYAGILYRRRICIQCKLPCPVNPNRKNLTL